MSSLNKYNTQSNLYICSYKTATLSKQTPTFSYNFERKNDKILYFIASSLLDTLLIGLSSHWFPNVTLVTQLAHHLIDLPTFTTLVMWVRVGGFSKVVATFNHMGGSFNLFMATTGYVWIIPSCRIWVYVLHVEHISCHHEWWDFSESSLFLSQKLFRPCCPEQNTTHICRLFLQIFCSSMLLFLYSFLLPSFSLLSSGWVFIAVCDSSSVQGTI